MSAHSSLLVSDSLSDVIPLSQSHCACARAVAEASASKSKQKPYGRRFIPKWTETFSWIEYRIETLKVYCKICTQASKLGLPLQSQM